MRANQIASVRLILLLACWSGILGAPVEGRAQEPTEPAAVTPPSTDGPTPVGVGLYVVDVANIDETRNTFEVELDVLASWLDPRLAFEVAPGGSDRRIYLGTAAQKAHAEMWIAQVTAVNAVGEPTIRSMKLTTFADGRVTVEGRFNAVLRAPFDFRRFPLDHQVLPIRLEPFAWNRDAVRLVQLPDQTGFDPAFELPEWAIDEVRTSVGESARVRDPVPFSRLTFEIAVHRRSGFYFWKILLPLFAIVAISWVVFWMSEEGLGRRASVSVTGILTVIAYQFIAAASLPRVAYLTTMDQITLLSVLLIAATLLESVIVDQVGHRNVAAKQRIDRTCRWAFPALYVLLVAVIGGKSLLGR